VGGREHGQGVDESARTELAIGALHLHQEWVPVGKASHMQDEPCTKHKDTQHGDL
jgi:hypothetical protein